MPDLFRILGVVLQSISITFGMFVAGRFWIGFGVAIAHGASPLLLTELVHPQDRSIFTTIYNTTWYLGAIISAWLTFGTAKMTSNWSWRIPSIVQALPSVLQLIFIWAVPESPRWLVAKGRDEEALKVLGDVHANGNQQDELVQLEYNEIRDTIRMEQELKNGSWKELVATRGNRHRLIILLTAGFFSQWSGNGSVFRPVLRLSLTSTGLVSYYIKKVLDLAGITDSTTQLGINGGLQIFNFIVALTMCFYVDKVGRRKLFLISTGGMLAAFIVWTICSEQAESHGTKAAGNAVVAVSSHAN